jgi:hypothetical protein
MIHEKLNHHKYNKSIIKSLGKPISQETLSESMIIAFNNHFNKFNKFKIPINPAFICNFYKKCLIKGYLITLDSYKNYNSNNCFILVEKTSRNFIIENYYKVKHIIEIKEALYCFCNEIVLKTNKKLKVSN